MADPPDRNEIEAGAERSKSLYERSPLLQTLGDIGGWFGGHERRFGQPKYRPLKVRWYQLVPVWGIPLIVLALTQCR